MASHRSDVFHFLALAVRLLFPMALLADAKLDALIVYGEGFAFTVKEPAGWHGETETAAQYSSNVLFYPKSATTIAPTPVIRVSVVDKTDEHIEHDLDADLKGYRDQHPVAIYNSLAVSHPVYNVVSKIFVVPHVSFEYVTYVNPGPTKNLIFSIAMNTRNVEATETELRAYRAVIASLNML